MDQTLALTNPTLFYQMLLQKQFSKLKKSNSSNFFQSKLENFEDYSNLIFSIIDQEFHSNILDNDELQRIEKIIMKFSYLSFLTFLSPIIKPKVYIDSWDLFIKRFRALPMKQLQENNEKSKILSQLDLLLIIFAAQTDFVFNRMLNLKYYVSKALEESNFDNSNPLFGKVLFSCFTHIEDTMCTLIVSPGFIELLNVSPSITDKHEILPPVYNMKCSNSSPLLFVSPLQTIKVCPVSKTSALVISPGGSFVAQFPEESSLTDFLIIVHLRKYQLKVENSINIPFLKRNTSNINVSFSSTSVTKVIQIKTNILDHSWTKQLQIKDYLYNISATAQDKENTVLAVPNEAKTFVPTHFNSKGSYELFGFNAQPEKIIKETTSNTIITQKDIKQHFCYSLLVDILVSPNEKFVYNISKHFNIISYSNCIEHNCPDVMKLYEEAFPSNFNNELLLNHSILYFASRFLRDIQAIRNITQQISINGKDSLTNETGILGAIRNKDEQINAFIDSGADLEYSENLVHPLILAIENGYNDKLITLLTNMCSANCPSTPLSSAIRYCIARHKNESLKTIAPLLGISVNVATAQNEFPINTCIICNNREALEILIKYCPDLNPNVQSTKFPPSIHYMIETKESEEMLKTLLSHPKTNLNIYNYDGQTPLTRSIELSSTNVISMLLKDKRCNPNMPNSDKSMPIHVAARTKNYEAMQLLLKSGALIDMPTPEGETALHIAIKNNDMHMLKILKKYNTQSSLWYFDGKLPEDIASNELIAELNPPGTESHFQISEKFVPRTIVFK